MTGELVRIVTSEGDPGDPSDDQYEVQLPREMVDWLYEHNWVQEHGDWHNVRRWDMSCFGKTEGCTAVAEMEARGLSRAPIQESEPGDGYAFLVMHRHMIEGFAQAFPRHTELLRGFTKVPVSRDDPENPIAWIDVKWSQDQLAAIDLLQDIENNLSLFDDEDDLGGWIQLVSGMGGFPGGGPPPGFDGGLPPDFDGGFPGSGSGGGDGGVTLDSKGRPPGGIHGGLHGQWTVLGSPTMLSDNNTNIPDFAFWRLHGWIDDMWERYRKAKGIGKDDPKYQAEMLAQCEEMHTLGMAKPRTGADGGITETGVFAEEVAPILATYCSGCHAQSSPSQGLVLAGAAPSAVRAGLVSVKSTEVDMPLVDPTSVDGSWLVRKLEGDFSGVQCSGCTSKMPPAGASPTSAEIDVIRAWIAAGAQAN